MSQLKIKGQFLLSWLIVEKRKALDCVPNCHVQVIAEAFPHCNVFLFWVIPRRLSSNSRGITQKGTHYI